MKQARPTSDDAVRLIREQSRRRIAERNRWRAFSSWCALATLASGISLTALSGHDARLQEEEAATQAAIATRARLQEEESAARRVAEAAVLRAKQEAAARAQDEVDRATIRAQAGAAAAANDRRRDWSPRKPEKTHIIECGRLRVDRRGRSDHSLDDILSSFR